VVGERGALFGHVHYAATKSGQIGMVKTLARTAAPLGITVNAIAPGVILTELLLQTHGEDGVRALGEDIPLGLGSVEDIGAAAVYLASDEAHYVTGATIDVNGGTNFR
jgi:NAD(P)-dependent dehydrogenase (short-subunit alcohol dehydrogenase family)